MPEIKSINGKKYMSEMIYRRSRGVLLITAFSIDG